MTPQETAEKIRDMLRALGCPSECGASGHPMTKGSWWVTAGEGSLEEPVFDCGADGVAFRSVRSSVGTLRVRKATTDWVAIEQRCAEVAPLNVKRVAHKASVQEAWAVVDELKTLGMTATMQEGRVRITLDFSPEYAREMGPKIATMLGRAEGSVVTCAACIEIGLGGWSTREHTCGAPPLVVEIPASKNRASDQQSRVEPWWLCNHANEVPRGLCDCPERCSCREKMCGALR